MPESIVDDENTISNAVPEYAPDHLSNFDTFGIPWKVIIHMLWV